MNKEKSLLEIKIVLKKWENDFLKKHSRKPTKDDVSSCEIEKVYKNYSNLKQKIAKEKKVQQQGKINSSTNHDEAAVKEKNKLSQENNSKVKSASESCPKPQVWDSSLLKQNEKKEVNEKNEVIDKKETVVQKASYQKLEKTIDLSKVKTVSLKTLKNFRRTDNISSKVNEKLEKPVEEANSVAEKKVFGASETIGGFRSAELVRNSQKLYNAAESLRKLRERKIVHRPMSQKWIEKASKDIADLAAAPLKTPEPIKTPLTEFPKTQKSDHDTCTDENNKGRTSPIKKEEIKTAVANNPMIEKEGKVEVDNLKQGATNEENEKWKADKSGDDLNNKITGEDVATSSKLPTTSSSSSKKTTKLVSNNFVRIQMKQKFYSRNGNKGKYLRKQVYREKLAKKGMNFGSGWKGRSGGYKAKKTGEFRDKSEDKCFKCGQNGHWASNCPGIGGGMSNGLDDDNDSSQTVTAGEILKHVPDHVLAICRDVDGDWSSAAGGTNHVRLTQTRALFPSREGYDRDEVVKTLHKFGYDNFRPGQEEAVKRILCGEPTVVVLSTGAGKSLCYQLPAYLYSKHTRSITIVVSPLVSLMDDQVRGLPKFLKAVRIHSGMTKPQREKAMNQLENDEEVAILMLSPEAITCWAGMSPHSSPLSKLPPVAFVCLDECHCISDWSHNFRPSYLRLCQVLIEELSIDRLVGLTATANKQTCSTIAKQLGITNEEEGVITHMKLPKNLSLSVSRDIYKDEALELLLSGERFSALDSIIIYCTRREEVVRVAALLRTKLQPLTRQTQQQSDKSEEEFEVDEEDGETSKGRKRKKKKAVNSKSKKQAVQWDADCYHAGMSAADRRRVQQRFMNGSLRIVVATVAFGMGIDKRDVRAVIHYNMPTSFDRYVQETGRAGRDGLQSHCHLFLDHHGEDMYELSRHPHSKSVDRCVIIKFVKQIFAPCRHCPQPRDEEKCSGHYVGFHCEQTIEDLDLEKEGIETLMCYLESSGYVKVHLSTEITCKIRCYDGNQQLSLVAQKCPAVAAALQLKESDEKIGGTFSFSMIEVANKLRTTLSDVRNSLRQLSWDSTLKLGGDYKGSKSGVSVEMCDSSFVLRTLLPSSDELLERASHHLYARMCGQERKELKQLTMCFDTMKKFAKPNAGCCMDDFDEGASEKMKNLIDDYFGKEEDDDESAETQHQVQLDDSAEKNLRQLCRQFLLIHGGDIDAANCSGRVLARIFHGIGSPRYPAKSWGKARRFWRVCIDVDFNAVIRIATEEIVKWR